MHNSDMRRFVKYVSIYIIVLLVLLLPVQIYEMYTQPDGANAFDGAVRNAAWVSKIRTQKRVKKLIIGDSTGQALYPYDKNNDTILSLASNQAITMAGQYFLIKNFVDANSGNLPEEVILLYSPFSFSNDVDYLAYHYFLKPFPYWKYRHLYTPHLRNRIHSIPWYWTANLPFIQNSRYTPPSAIPPASAKESMSQVSYEYLKKIIEITLANGIEFSLVCTPVRQDRVEEIGVFMSDVTDGRYRDIEDYLQDFMQSINYMSADLFIDDVHLYDEYVPNDYLQLFSSKNE